MPESADEPCAITSMARSILPGDAGAQRIVTVAIGVVFSIACVIDFCSRINRPEKIIEQLPVDDQIQVAAYTSPVRQRGVRSAGDVNIHIAILKAV